MQIWDLHILYILAYKTYTAYFICAYCAYFLHICYCIFLHILKCLFLHLDAYYAYICIFWVCLHIYLLLFIQAQLEQIGDVGFCGRFGAWFMVSRSLIGGLALTLTVRVRLTGLGGCRRPRLLPGCCRPSPIIIAWVRCQHDSVTVTVVNLKVGTRTGSARYTGPGQSAPSRFRVTSRRTDAFKETWFDLSRSESLNGTRVT